MSPEDPAQTVFTIGHSNHAYETFFRLLASHSVQVLIDVRSAPYSKYVPHFNKRQIEEQTVGQGLVYMFMGDQVGGKPAAAKWYDENGKVCYDRLARSPEFLSGISRIRTGLAKGYRIALMCAEEDPLHCHRHLLIARTMEECAGITVRHIRGDGALLCAADHLQKEGCQLSLF